MYPMFEFNVASESAIAEQKIKDEEPISFGILGQTFQARRPLPGEINVLFATQGGGEGTRAIWRFLRNVLLPSDRAQGRSGWLELRDMVEEGKFPPDLLFGGDEDNEQGVVDHIVSVWAGRPTPSSSDSSTSLEATGSISTARAPGEGSIS